MTPDEPHDTERLADFGYEPHRCASDSLKIDDVIEISEWRAEENDVHVANAQAVTDAGGVRLFAGSSADTETNEYPEKVRRQSQIFPDGADGINGRARPLRRYSIECGGRQDQ